MSLKVTFFDLELLESGHKMCAPVLYDNVGSYFICK